MYRWSKISTTKFIAFSIKSMGCFLGKIFPYFTRKCTILNIYFPNFSGGNTPWPPLREGWPPPASTPSTAFGRVWGRKRPRSSSPQSAQIGAHEWQWHENRHSHRRRICCRRGKSVVGVSLSVKVLEAFEIRVYGKFTPVDVCYCDVIETTVEVKNAHGTRFRVSSVVAFTFIASTVLSIMGTSTNTN